MPDTTALELAERDVSAGITTTSLATEVRRFVVGALLTAALAAAGTVLFTLALAAAVVGSPVLAVGMAYLLVRRAREARARPAAIPAF